MPTSRTSCRFLVATFALATFLVWPLHAQASGDASMVFPRESLAWFVAGDADKLWARSSPSLRTLMGSAQQMRENSVELQNDMGRETALLSEQQFDHPEGKGARVYVRAARHAVVPELFWVVIYSPAEQQVQMIMAQPRQTIRTLFPQVKLP